MIRGRLISLGALGIVLAFLNVSTETAIVGILLWSIVYWVLVDKS